MASSSRCAACDRPGLRYHLEVAGEAGTDGLIPTTDRFGKALADIFRCPTCGHMQLEPMPDESMLAQAYAQAASDDYVKEEAGQRETARRTLALMEHYAPARGKLLDLGCWVGFLLAEARQRGWDTCGVEPSQFAAEYAQEKLGLQVIKADLLSAELPAHVYDAVTMGDVIEHLPCPADALRRVRELLAARGILWLALPDAGSLLARTMGRRWWSVLPTHVQYFTRGSISTLLARNGFEVLNVITAPKAFSVHYYLERTGGYSEGLSRALVAGAQRLGVANRMWAPDFRDRMAVIARLS
jgi:SAM-dependent methyltransferase